MGDLNQICEKWRLTDLVALPKRTFFAVYRAKRTVDQMPVIVKFGIDAESIKREALALKTFDGMAAVKLYDFDESNSALLLELITPGVDLKVLFPKQDDQAICVAVQIIKKLHSNPQPDVSLFPKLEAWLGDFSCSSHVPAAYLEKAKSLSRNLIASAKNVALLHGDLHHENILKSDSRDYLAIDPKGIIGDTSYEVIPFLCNPLPEILHHAAIAKLLQHRIQLFATLLNIEENRLRDWSFVHAVAAACWAIEDNLDPHPWLRLAEIFDHA